MKPKSKLAICATLTLASLVTAGAVLTMRNITRTSDAAYQTIDDAFAIRRSQGWTLTSAPTDGKRYRICGATESDPTADASRFNGSFESGGRSVSFDVEVPDRAIVAVEGLEPMDGGPLTYAVLTRDLAE